MVAKSLTAKACPNDLKKTRTGFHGPTMASTKSSRITSGNLHLDGKAVVTVHQIGIIGVPIELLRMSPCAIPQKPIFCLVEKSPRNTQQNHKDTLLLHKQYSSLLTVNRCSNSTPNIGEYPQRGMELSMVQSAPSEKQG